MLIPMNYVLTSCHCINQGLWASSLQFTSLLEFNAIFRTGIYDSNSMDEENFSILTF